MKPLHEQRILFVTGRLAEPALRDVIRQIAEKLGFSWDIAVPGVQVAALLHVQLLLKRLDVSPDFDRIILPGWCQGDIGLLERKFGRPVETGPKDLRDLPEYFGLGKKARVNLDRYSIEIIGEINHATRQPLNTVIREAINMRQSGADVIDVGCVPGESSSGVYEIVRQLKAEGLRVSIDSFDRAEVEAAVNAGAELILSCNSSNIDWITKSGTEVVVIPDHPSDFGSLHSLVQQVNESGTPFRIDPIIEPIGMGFAASLQRYMRARQEFPNTPIMMGIGNVTELTETDSAGVNMVLAAICEELGIQSVLTTQVIPWCRTAIAEFNVARRLAWYAVSNGVLPKHLSSDLVMLRDPRWQGRSADSLQGLAEAITDANFRIFAEDGQIHLMNRNGYDAGVSPFEIFQKAILRSGNQIDSAHAFYLGYEMARAELALHLGKQYEQDSPMRWGLLGPLSASSAVHHPEPADSTVKPPGTSKTESAMPTETDGDMKQ